MGICAIIPAANIQSANNTLGAAGYGYKNFSIPCFTAAGPSFAVLYARNHLPFEAAVKLLPGVVWEPSDGSDIPGQTQALVESQGAIWGATAPPLPDTGVVLADTLYRTSRDMFWYVIQQLDRDVYPLPPEEYPAHFARYARPGVVVDWWQPITQYDAPKLVNKFTGLPDQRRHNGQVWKVVQADGAGNNVWEPGVFGWAVVSQ